MRNNFLTKNIKFSGKIATWQDIVDVYKTDCIHAEARLLHKLTDESVLPEKIKKMKVFISLIKILHNNSLTYVAYTYNDLCYIRVINK